jgi:hypothetical protein
MMRYSEASSQDIRAAQKPHNLYIGGVLLLNLLLTPAVIALKLGMIGLLVPLVLTCTLIVYIFLRSQRPAPWFVNAHWRLCFSRARLLLLGYAISGTLVLLGWLVSQTADNPSMAHIVWTALTRIAVVPALIFVLVTAVLEFSAIGQAANREVPDKYAGKFPPPRE